jgi:hypothetical protein
MPYKVEYDCGTGYEDWNVVIDMNLSKTKPVERIFMTDEQAQNFINKDSGGKQLERYRIIDMDEENAVEQP